MDINAMREAMVREWGLQDLPPAEVDAAIEKIGEVLYQSIVLRATAEFDEAEMKEFDAFAASKGPAMNAAEALDWLHAKVPNFDAMAAEETQKLKSRILAQTQ